MNVRDQLDQHIAIEVVRLTQDTSIIDNQTLAELADLAHEAVHPPEAEESGAANEAGNRQLAVHLATQIICTRLQSSGGLSGLEIDDKSVVTQAESILGFLQG